jgi:hypothetical protein
MKKLPLTVIVIGCLYVVVGVGAAVGHLAQYNPHAPFDYDIVWASLVNLMALVAGIFMLRAANWARWLAIVWMGVHVGLSVFHARLELVLHSLLFVVLVYFLFRPRVNKFFRGDATNV